MYDTHSSRKVRLKTLSYASLAIALESWKQRLKRAVEMNASKEGNFDELKTSRDEGLDFLLGTTSMPAASLFVRFIPIRAMKELSMILDESDQGGIQCA